VPLPARYRAPSESGQKLVVPPWPELGALVDANLAWRTQHDIELLGRSLGELTADARREIGELTASDARAPLIATGHQPGLVHPGVWIKNFAAAQLAADLGGAGLHVIIDADVCRTPAILVPSRTVEHPRAASVEFDLAASAQPWEERRILNHDLWRSFPERVHAAADGLLGDLFLDEWWPRAVERAAETGLVGAALAEARRDAEIAWGLHNAELPQSQLCQTAAFQHFVVTLLAELPRFVAAHNEALGEYRWLHGLRNHAHPAPNLATDGPWLEAPFWIWSKDDPHRRPVFVRPAEGGLFVSDRRKIDRRLPLTEPNDAAAAVATLAEWEAAGIKLRSRALITTLFTRLVVADLFIHGIGGAKYDEATDAISRQFFGVTPPAFAVMSGTLRLPIPHRMGQADDTRQLRGELRELTFHPERRLAASPPANGQRDAVAALVAEKSRWIRTPKAPAVAAERHRGIVAANAGLQPFVAADRQRLEDNLAAALDGERARRVLESREYAFCLFPREELRKFLLDFRLPAR
jgi:hypothetical protein